MHTNNRRVSVIFCVKKDKVVFDIFFLRGGIGLQSCKRDI